MGIEGDPDTKHNLEKDTKINHAEHPRRFALRW